MAVFEFFKVPDDLDGPKMRKMGSNASALLMGFMNERPRIDEVSCPGRANSNNDHARERNVQ